MKNLLIIGMLFLVPFTSNASLNFNSYTDSLGGTYTYGDNGSSYSIGNTLGTNTYYNFNDGTSGTSHSYTDTLGTNTYYDFDNGLSGTSNSYTDSLGTNTYYNFNDGTSGTSNSYTDSLGTNTYYDFDDGTSGVINSNDNNSLINNSYTTSNDYIASIVNNIRQLTIAKEKDLTISDLTFYPKHKGKIFLQVEERGEAWYIDFEGKRHYMASGQDAFDVLRSQGVGISNINLQKLKDDLNFSFQYRGKIFLQVEDLGQAYYVDFFGIPHYLKDGDTALQLLRQLGTGITNDDIRKFKVFE